jgi:hypothetical protein
MQRLTRLGARFGWAAGFLVLVLLGCTREEPDAPVAGGSPPEAVTTQTAMEGTVLRQVQSWGPESTQAGVPFNRQPNGDSAFWIVSTGESQVIVELAGRPLPTTVRADIVTASVPQTLVATLLAEPGDYELALTDPASGRRQRVGEFEVE